MSMTSSLTNSATSFDDPGVVYRQSNPWSQRIVTHPSMTVCGPLIYLSQQTFPLCYLYP